MGFLRGSTIAKCHTHLKAIIEQNSFSSFAHGLPASRHWFWVASTSPQSLFFWLLLRTVSLHCAQMTRRIERASSDPFTLCGEANLPCSSNRKHKGNMLCGSLVSSWNCGRGGCPWKHPSKSHFQVNVVLACLGLDPRGTQMLGNVPLLSRKFLLIINYGKQNRKHESSDFQGIWGGKGSFRKVCQNLLWKI